VWVGHIIRISGDKQKKGDEMKRIVMLILLLTMLVSLGGCFWGFEGRGRGGDRDDRGGGHDRGGDRGGDREERR
jgi:hypothetical protein